MMYWNYDRLTEITSKNPPFRGTPNKFPWDYKRRSAKCIYVSAKKSILKELYRRNPIFTEREFKAGETYPASTWGITLRVDGKEVEQCY